MTDTEAAHPPYHEERKDESEMEPELKKEEPVASTKRLRDLGVSFEKDPMNEDFFRAVFAELLGTCLLVFYGVTTQRMVHMNFAFDPSSQLLIAFQFAMTTTVLVYMFWEMSGAHFNPAVTLGHLLTKRANVMRAVLYWCAQIGGGIAGAGLATTFGPSDQYGENFLVNQVDDHEAFGGEVVCTFVLVMAYFAARDAQMNKTMPHVQGLLPLFIGLSVFIGYLAMLPIDLGSLNPARSFATSVTTGEWDDHWVFWIGPFVGAMFAVVFWEGFLRPKVPDQEETATA